VTRAAVRGLGTAYPMAERLPALYAEDQFAARFLGALDDVLAPALSVLDCLPAYLDPRLTPGDFLDWLAGWVAADADPGWSEAARREAVHRAVELHRLRGTREGLAAEIRMMFGVDATVEENGGAAWSRTPGGPLPGSREPALTVRVRVPDPAAFPTARLRDLVEASRPVHVPIHVEVVKADEGL
jgi:phage tail-like protein